MTLVLGVGGTRLEIVSQRVGLGIIQATLWATFCVGLFFFFDNQGLTNLSSFIGVFCFLDWEYLLTSRFFLFRLIK